MFSEIIGNERIKGYLTRLVEKNRVGHSLLFEGPEGVGKSLFAEAFAKLLFCQEDPKGSHLHKLKTRSHPDLHVYRPEGKTGMHSIASMRSLREEVYLPPYEANCKVFIIHDADRMLPYSANALLKTFEEPSQGTVIILLSNSAKLLLPTILSRCSTFHFHALEEEEIVALLTTKKKVEVEKAKQIAILSQGSVSKAFGFMQEKEDPLRVAVLQLLIMGKFGSYSLLAAKAKELAELIEGSTKSIENESKEAFLKEYCDKPSAVQRESIEKELEGLAAMHSIRKADEVFDLILTWYRDLHLLHVNGPQRYLQHPDYLQELLQQNKIFSTPQGPGLIPLEKLFNAVKTCKLALARSTALHLCLENLFLRLNLV